MTLYYVTVVKSRSYLVQTDANDAKTARKSALAMAAEGDCIPVGRGFEYSAVKVKRQKPPPQPS